MDPPPRRPGLAQIRICIDVALTSTPLIKKKKEILRRRYLLISCFVFCIHHLTLRPGTIQYCKSNKLKGGHKTSKMANDNKSNDKNKQT